MSTPAVAAERTPYSRRADPVDVAVGERIRSRRKQLGLSQSQLAESLGVAFQQVQKYEHGTNRISASMLVRAAAKLQTTVAELVGQGHSPPIDKAIREQLAVPGAIELLRAYTAIQQTDARRALVTAARALTRSRIRRRA